MEIIGKLKVKGETQTFGSKGFRKKEIVVTTDEQYPQHIKIELLQDKVDLINDFNVGDNIKVHINLGGREWINPQGEAKYFNSITGWRIEKKDINALNVPNQPQTINEEGEDDLPFN